MFDKRAGRVGGAAVAVVGPLIWAAFGGATAAGADPGWNDPDDNPHSYCFGSGMSTWERNETHDQMLWNDNNTDMNRQFDSTCDWTAPMTDMHVMDVDLPPGVRGEADCTSSNWINCDRYDVRLDTAEITAQGGPFGANVRKTICHEIGHSLSLDHYNKNADGTSPVFGQHDCMISGVVDANVQWRLYGQHHINDHINGQF